MADTLTEEEHKARAMLMGMRYHDGNGEPFYYKQDEGIVDISSIICADTMKPLAQSPRRDQIVDAARQVNQFMKGVALSRKLFK